MAVTGGADTQEHWSGRAGFILAAVGSAVGLGNLVRFPYVAGDSGGSAFVLIYFLAILFIGLPVLMAELIIGRRGGGSAIAAVSRLARSEGQSKLWVLFPIIGALASFLIVSYYSVLAGWVLHFLGFSVTSLFDSFGELGLGALSAPAFATQGTGVVGEELGGLVSDPTRMILLHGLFMGITVFILSRGVKGGIEAAAKIMMPIFFLLLLGLTIFSLINGNDAEALKFLFTPDFSKVDGTVVLRAVGQAFFSLSLGSAMMITYGLYMSRDADIPGSARIVAGADTAVALIAGLAIFPIVFASPVLTQAVLQEDPGLGLLFQTVPLAFAEMPFGGLFAILFFLMTTFAALTSSIALLEVAVAWWDGDVTVPAERRRRRRAIGAVVLGSLAFLIGVGNALSQVPASAQDTFFNTWVPLGGVAIFEGETFLDAIDTLTADLMLPLGGVLTAIFAGWVMSATASREELQFKSERSFSFWRFLVRWVAPVVVLSILLYGTVIGPMLAGSEDEVSEAAQVIEEMSTPDE